MNAVRIIILSLHYDNENRGGQLQIKMLHAKKKLILLNLSIYFEIIKFKHYKKISVWSKYEGSLITRLLFYETACFLMIKVRKLFIFDLALIK